MIVQDHKAEEGAVHLVLFRRELQQLVEILENPKRRVSKTSKTFGRELREAIREAHGE